MGESAAAHAHEAGEQLVMMANDIGDYFRAQGREAAITGIANHIKRNWTLRMRQKLNAYLAAGNGGLDELPLAALATLDSPGPGKA